MVLSVRDLSFSYGGNRVLTDVSFQIEEKERAALVGYNGCGKTTLLHLISGELTPDTGEISLKSNAVVGILKQDSGLDPARTVEGEMKSANNADQLLERMKRLERSLAEDPSLIDEYNEVTQRYESINGYELDYRIRKLLIGMGFPEEAWSKRVGVLSGGEKTRLSLAKLLLQEPDLLLLDEPTNHLDLETMDWLEDYLKEYAGAVLMVSHDRHFLDATCGKTIDLQNGKTKTYSCAFSEYVRRKAEDERVERIHYQQTLEEAEKLRDYAERNIVRASTSNMAKSRLKMLDRLDLTAPEDSRHVDLKFTITPSGEPYKEVLVMEGLTVGVAGHKLCEDLDLTIRRGERYAVIGQNGIGKTTLLKIILGDIPADSGYLRLGQNVMPGYYDQEQRSLTGTNTVLEELHSQYIKYTQTELRSILGAFLFRGDDVFKSVADLSGGEKARLALLKLMMSGANLLIFDEPTNHLDIASREVLEDALDEYNGTMIIVTHDRYLVNRLADRIFHMSADGMKEYVGGYDDYLEAQKNVPEETAAEGKQLSANAAEYRERKLARSELTKAKTAAAKAEKAVADAEAELKGINEKLASPAYASDYAKAGELSKKADEISSRLEKLYEEWEQAEARLAEAEEK
jgi:ATP-binding cassette subfamily F protein 3